MVESGSMSRTEAPSLNPLSVLSITPRVCQWQQQQQLVEEGETANKGHPTHFAFIHDFIPLVVIIHQSNLIFILSERMDFLFLNSWARGGRHLIIMMMATMIYEQVGRGNKWECCQMWGILLPQCLLTSRTNHDGRWISSHIFFNAVNHGMADADSVQPDPHHTIECLYLSRALSSRKSSSASVEKIWE